MDKRRDNMSHISVLPRNPDIGPPGIVADLYTVTAAAAPNLVVAIVRPTVKGGACTYKATKP